MDSITLENFINYCDEMQIAEEGFREGSGVIDKIINTLQLGLEWIKRAILKLKEKTSKGKYIEIPKIVHADLTNMEREIMKFHNNDASKLDDKNMENIKADVEKHLKLAKEHKNDNGPKSAIPISELYQNMQVESKNISGGIKYAESLKKRRDSNNYTEYIHRLNNEVDLMHLYTKINKFYLECPVISNKYVGAENPDTQVVTQEERDSSKKNSN